MLISVAHAGRDYPDWLVGMARGGRAALESLEDPIVDRLVDRAMDRGIGAVIARAPRAAVDCNRDEDEIDPTVVRDAGVGRATARARGGLGIVPGRTALHGALWLRPIDPVELEDRLAEAHRPFHQAIERELRIFADRFGCALLLDCHSMPAPVGGGPQIVMGDRYGRTSAGWLSAEALRIARKHGFTAGLNEPFAGGHTIERHGRPESGIHALQVEIDRRCYLRSDGCSPGWGFAAAAAFLEDLAFGLGSVMLDRQLPAAAE